MKVFKNLSLRYRAALAAALTLMLFFSLAGFGLLRAYEDSLNNAAEGELRAYMLSLLGAIDVNEQGEVSLDSLSVSAFNQPNSGVYAEVWQEQNLLWRSDSLISQELPKVESELGEYHFFSSITDDVLLSQDKRHVDLMNNVLSLKIDWNDGVISEQYQLIVANDALPFLRRQQGYKKNLLFWLMGLGLGLVFLQILLFRWLFRPINKVIDELSLIQTGEQTGFSGEYPREVDGLTQSLNGFLENEGRHIKRVKESLANLAHSLKTPLAVIQTELFNKNIDKNVLQEQVDRINTIVNYQLNRTSSSVRPSYRKAVSCHELVNRLITVMQRLHEPKGIHFHSEIAPKLVFRGDVDDLAEVLGNVLENACKWTKKNVFISANNDEKGNLFLYVLDDGVGIPEGKVDDVLQRGKRLDVKTEGQGIGLSMVNDIVESYQGEVELKSAYSVNEKYNSGLAVVIRM